MSAISPEECNFMIRTRNYTLVAEVVKHRDRDQDIDYQTLHRMMNVLVCGTSVFLNAVLFHIIRTQSARLRSLRPILMFGCAFDIWFSVVSLQIGALPASTMGVVFVYDNQLMPWTSVTALTLLKMANGTSTFCSWWIMSLQFLWRLYVVKHGRSPPLPCMLLTLLVIVPVVAVVAGAVYFMHGQMDESQRDVLIQIAHFNGFYRIIRAEVSGGFSDEDRFKVYNMVIRLSTVQLYVVTLTVDYFMNRHMRQHPRISTRTSSLFKGVRKAFLCMAVGPFFTSTLPALLVTRNTDDCSPHPYYMLAASLLTVSQTLINACTTMYYIQPYRSYLLGRIVQLRSGSALSTTKSSSTLAVV